MQDGDPDEATHLQRVSVDARICGGPARAQTAQWSPHWGGSQGLDAAAKAQTLPPAAASALTSTA